MLRNICDGRIGSVVGPNRVHAGLVQKIDAEIASIAFVRAVGHVAARRQLRHVNIAAGDVLDWRIGSLTQLEGIARIGDDEIANTNHYAFRIGRNRYRMIGVGCKYLSIGHLSGFTIALGISGTSTCIIMRG